MEIVGTLCCRGCFCLHQPILGHPHWHLGPMHKSGPAIHCLTISHIVNSLHKHLADLLCFPVEIMHYFRRGIFVSITGWDWHSLGVDEAHEMLIDKSCKRSVVHPSRDDVSRIANYLPYHTTCIENLRKQIFPKEAMPVHNLLQCSLHLTESSDK